MYSDSEDGIEDNSDMNSTALFMGLMGINIRAQRGYMVSLKNIIKKSDDKDQIKSTIGWLRNFYENTTHVETANSNINKMLVKADPNDIQDI